MSSPVTLQYLLEGAIYALEQCGLLLRDANILFRNGSYASAVVLAAFAREELGRSTILFNLRREVITTGKSFTRDEVQDRCDDHETKQKAGMLSTTISGNGVVERLIRAYLQPAENADQQNAHAELEKIRRLKEKRVPGERHKRRMSSLYVEPISETQWNRPANISAPAAHEFLRLSAITGAGTIMATVPLHFQPWPPATVSCTMPSNSGWVARNSRSPKCRHGSRILCKAA